MAMVRFALFHDFLCVLNENLRHDVALFIIIFGFLLLFEWDLVNGCDMAELFVDIDLGYFVFIITSNV
jgi:hypothetical protein